jgi:hypothetical protein
VGGGGATLPNHSTSRTTQPSITRHVLAAYPIIVQIGGSDVQLKVNEMEPARLMQRLPALHAHPQIRHRIEGRKFAPKLSYYKIVVMTLHQAWAPTWFWANGLKPRFNGHDQNQGGINFAC